ncbi:MAG: hypothetical protein J6B03_12320 [Candidatus Homeothermus sp.]|nr:hypothetical protein [Candidatus Homeothermus sp.]
MLHKEFQSWMKTSLPDRASSAFSRVVERSETHGKESTAPMFPQGIISEPLNDS